MLFSLFFNRIGFDNIYDDFPIDEVEDDPDILEDPIYSMDIQVSVLLYLFSSRPIVVEFVNNQCIRQNN